VGFNVTRFKKMGRDWARGEPPPRGHIEYVGVGDMFMEEPPKPASRSGFQVFEIGFTELDAADRWMKRLEDNIRYARQVHGDKILTASDVNEWNELMSRWVPFREKLTSASRSPAWIQMWLKDNKIELDLMLNQSKKMHDRFASKGMPMVPVPYMGELVLMLRKMPRQMRTPDMRAKLEAGVKCGDKMLDQNTAWWQWRKRKDASGLANSITDAKAAADLFARSRASDIYEPGSPVYDEFLRRLTKIYIEAAGLYGIVETKKTAVAEAVDEARKAGKQDTSHLLWLLVSAGVGYLGLRWISRPSPARIVVKVPDARPAQQP
jgi:hypothetical protein